MSPARALKIRLFLIGFTACMHSTYAQVNTDSLRSIWENVQISDSLRFAALNEYYLSTTYSSPDSSLVVANYHYRLAEQKRSFREMAEAMNEKGIAYFVKYDLDKSREMYLKTRNLWEQAGDRLSVAKTDVNLASNDSQRNNLREALNGYMRALKVFKELDYEYGVRLTLGNIGLIYYELNDFETALDYLCQDLTETNGNGGNANTFLNIGFAYFKLGQYELAIHYTEKALEQARVANNKMIQGNGLCLLAETNLMLNNRELAYSQVLQGLEIFSQLNAQAYSHKLMTLKAKILFDNNLYEATGIAEEVLAKMDKNTDLYLQVTLYQFLYECYKAQNKPNRSLAMHEKYVAFQDSLRVQQNNMAVIRQAIQDDYNSKIIESKIAHGNEKAALKLRQTRWKYTIFLICFILLTAAVFYIRHLNVSNRRKRDALLEEMEDLKRNKDSHSPIAAQKFELDKEKIEKHIDRKLNETDWNVLQILLDKPVISNKALAEKAFMSVDGIGSSLRRMYEYFEIKESKYKKISLITEAIKTSNEIQEPLQLVANEINI